MKIVITHNSPDLDAITSAWLIKKFLPGWEDAKVEFVPAGEKMKGSRLPHAENDARKNSLQSQSNPRSLSESRSKSLSGNTKDVSGSAFSSFSDGQPTPIEYIDRDEVIHVDTGLGPLDHHQTKDENVSAASLTWEFVKTQNSSLGIQNSKKIKDKTEAIGRIVKVVVDIDHFREVFWKDATSDYHEFSLIGILDGLKLEKPDQDGFYVDFVMECLDALLHQFENRIWAEREIKENGKKFKTRFGEGIGFETINDTVIKLSQKMGYVIVVRKDPRKGYVRIKALPALESQKEEIDLRLVYEKLKKIDPDATWFLHISGKMLLNGSVKNPKMRVTKLPLSDIIKVLEKI